MPLIDSIDDKTSVPLITVLCSLPFLVAAIMWLSSVDQKASAANAKLDELSNVKEMLQDVRERVIRIEEHQKDLEKRAKSR